MNEITDQTGILLEVGTNELEILEFFIEDTLEDGTVEKVYFGMNVAKVMQVIESPNLEEKQYSQNPCFLGTIPLREHILPVIDLSQWLGMNRQRTENDVVIVTEFSQAVTGFLVTGVTEIHRVGWQDVDPPSGYLAHVVIGSIVGTVQTEDHLIQLLDLESVLTDLDPEVMENASVSKVKASQAYKALIADDSPTIRAMVNANLVSANFVPKLVNNGREALDTLLGYKKQCEETGSSITDFVDIVVSDIEMPLMDGFTLTKNIKTDSVLGTLPVLLYSSIITDELRHKGESVKADEQISKPEIHKMAERAIALIEK